jgi:hypothetical protein
MSEYGRSSGSWKNILTGVGSILGVFAIVALISLGIWSIIANEPHSTSRVTEVSDGTIRLPAGETLIMKHNKTTWTIKYDGRGALTLESNAWFSDTRVEYLEPGVDTEIDFGWGSTSLHATADKQGNAYVSYPTEFLSSWHFRSRNG